MANIGLGKLSCSYTLTHSAVELVEGHTVLMESKGVGVDLRLDVRGKLLTERVGRCWNSCPERLWMPRPSVEVLTYDVYICTHHNLLLILFQSFTSH